MKPYGYSRLMRQCCDALECDVFGWINSWDRDFTYADMAHDLAHNYDITVSPETLRRWVYWYRNGR